MTAAMTAAMTTAITAAMKAVITDSLRLSLQNRSSSVLYADSSKHV